MSANNLPTWSRLLRCELACNGRSSTGGSSYSNWTDAAGNAYLNRTYTAAGALDTRTWATS